MNDFLSWDILLTYGGCVAGTIFITEWLKKMFSKIPTQIVSFVIATVILSVGHAVMGTFAVGQIPLYLINAVAVSLSANGGFDILNRAFGKKEEAAETLVISGDGNNSETYLDLSQDIDKYEDGEIVKFKVKKVTPQE